jgi:shikimate dehydrogenase
MKTLKAALIGRSLDHSISPEVHQMLFDVVRSKCNADYEVLEYSKTECHDEHECLSVIAHGLENGFRGFNITLPYKYAALSVVGECSALVKLIRSANVILCDAPPKIASTDGNGFRFALEKIYPDILFENYSLTILGAGGAARAVLHSMVEFGWKKITVAARSSEQAVRAARSYKDIAVFRLDKISRDAATQFIVQATPVGQRTGESLLENFEWKNGDIAADLVYNPLRTHFLDRAANMGAKIVDGLGMLIEQAALSQYVWMTGKESDRSILTSTEFWDIYTALSKLVTPRWDAFVT